MPLGTTGSGGGGMDALLDDFRILDIAESRPETEAFRGALGAILSSAIEG